MHREPQQLPPRLPCRAIRRGTRGIWGFLIQSRESKSCRDVACNVSCRTRRLGAQNPCPHFSFRAQPGIHPAERDRNDLGPLWKSGALAPRNRRPKWGFSPGWIRAWILSVTNQISNKWEILPKSALFCNSRKRFQAATILARQNIRRGINIDPNQYTAPRQPRISLTKSGRKCCILPPNPIPQPISWGIELTSGKF